MAIKDVKEYYYTMLMQYIEEKQNLADFEEALRDGHITEDQMAEAMETVAKLEENYHRLAYVMYLFDIPNRKSKRARYLKQMEPIVQEFKRLQADLPSVQLENADVLAHFKAKLAELRQDDIKDE
jgi:benzoyl-CoA reductase/2-hydroxyglutaryl-CoA dehydratase subunit BcrC/BadD/HgdB